MATAASCSGSKKAGGLLGEREHSSTYPQNCHCLLIGASSETSYFTGAYLRSPVKLFSPTQGIGFCRAVFCQSHPFWIWPSSPLHPATLRNASLSLSPPFPHPHITKVLSASTWGSACSVNRVAQAFPFVPLTEWRKYVLWHVCKTQNQSWGCSAITEVPLDWAVYCFMRKLNKKSLEGYKIYILSIQTCPLDTKMLGTHCSCLSDSCRL